MIGWSHESDKDFNVAIDIILINMRLIFRTKGFYFQTSIKRNSEELIRKEQLSSEYLI